MIKALNEIEVITLFVEDLASTKAFYKKVFGHEVVYEDAVSSVMTLGSVMINGQRLGDRAALDQQSVVRRAKLRSIPKRGVTRSKEMMK